MLEGNYGAIRAGKKDDERIKMIPRVRDFLKLCRDLSIPVIFACDSFLKDDFIFLGRMKPHTIRGTKGTQPLSELEPAETDIIVEKRRFSAFFKTDLDQTLRTMHVDTVVVGGINTNVCVLTTAFDAISHDFYTIILEDLSAAHNKEIHKNFLNAYRNSAMYPLFKVMTSQDFLNEMKQPRGKPHGHKTPYL